MALTKVTNDLLALGESTSSLNLPKGTTAQRPISPVAGMVRENTDDNVIEYYNGTEWKQVKSTVPPILVDYLVIAGGGGGSRYGGGGAGGYRNSYNNETSGGNSSSETSLTLEPLTTYTITVGSGGNGGNRTAGSTGSNSVFATITSIGGGHGSATDYTGVSEDGGSGGGGDNPTAGGLGVLGQGTNGGPAGYGAGASYVGTGGGGAGQAGQDNPSPNVAGNGGDGLASSITGSSIFRAGGGGGASYNCFDYSCTGDGGSGGGGEGTYWSNGASPEIPNGIAGTANTGSGGGAAMNGGSGVVILRLLTSQYSGATTGSPTVTTDGSHTVLTYTSSGTYTA